MTAELTITRVANGWIIRPRGVDTDEFTYVAIYTVELAAHVEAWADSIVQASTPIQRTE